MNAKTLDALKSSIKHWERMATGTSRKNEAPKSEQCALCRMFNSPRHPLSCVGCPVKEKTGQWFCVGTPYQDALTAFNTSSKEDFEIKASKEVSFLRSLLPKKRKKK